MNEHDSFDDGIGLIDIYEFLLEAWRTIAMVAAIGAVLGLAAAFLLPEKFQASVSIQPGKVLGADVEKSSVLAEKMSSPSYYSEQTWSECGLLDASNPAQALVSSLKPAIPRKSEFVAVSFKSKSRKTSVACLNAVLEDVKKDQDLLARKQIDLATRTLELEKEKLKSAEEFVAKIAGKTLTFDIRDTQFPATQLFYVTLQAKQTEITELKKSIQTTVILLSVPKTQPASFLTPIYSPERKVEPKRAIIIVASTVAGAFLGFAFFALRAALRKVKLKAQAELSPK